MAPPRRGRKRMYRFFDKFEDRVRARLSRTPIFYAIVGGTAIVLFWRGVWEFATELQALGGAWAVAFSPLGSIVISVAVLLATGLFVSFFIGERIILSGLKREKKIEEKTEAEVRQEEAILGAAIGKLDRLEKEVKALADLVRERK